MRYACADWAVCSVWSGSDVVEPLKGRVVVELLEDGAWGGVGLGVDDAFVAVFLFGVAGGLVG